MTRKNRATSDDDKPWTTTSKPTKWSWLGGEEQKTIGMNTMNHN